MPFVGTTIEALETYDFTHLTIRSAMLFQQRFLKSLDSYL